MWPQGPDHAEAIATPISASVKRNVTNPKTAPMISLTAMITIAAMMSDPGEDPLSARPVQARAGRRQLAQVRDHLGGDPLARQQRRDARRVAGDRLGRDAADRLVHGTASAAPRNASRGGTTTSLRARPRRAPAPRPRPGRSIRRTVARSRGRSARARPAAGRGRAPARASRAWRARRARRRRSAARPRPRSRCSRCRARR